MQRIEELKRQEKFSDLAAKGKVKELNSVTHLNASVFHKAYSPDKTEVVAVKESNCHCAIL